METEVPKHLVLTRCEEEAQIGLTEDILMDGVGAIGLDRAL